MHSENEDGITDAAEMIYTFLAFALVLTAIAIVGGGC